MPERTRSAGHPRPAPRARPWSYIPCANYAWCECRATQPEDRAILLATAKGPPTGPGNQHEPVGVASLLEKRPDRTSLARLLLAPSWLQAATPQDAHRPHVAAGYAETNPSSSKTSLSALADPGGRERSGFRYFPPQECRRAGSRCRPPGRGALPRRGRLTPRDAAWHDGRNLRRLHNGYVAPILQWRQRRWLPAPRGGSLSIPRRLFRHATGIPLCA